MPKQTAVNPPLFGSIADDYSGGADLVSMLADQNVPTILILGVQPDEYVARVGQGSAAVVIALKSRSIAPRQACEMSLGCLHQLKSIGARQIQFKYCSTFDSTRKGNIGPVAEALIDALSAEFTVAVPALPVQGRTQYFGHLFVGEKLLSDSHMRHHPVTPMTDSNLVRHLQAQTNKKIGLVPHSAVRLGVETIQREAARLRAEGSAIALVDAVCDRDLEQIADAVVDYPLITGSSGLAMKLPPVWSRRGMLDSNSFSQPIQRMGTSKPGGVLILSGSCSAATLQQIQVLKDAGCPALRLDVMRLLSKGCEAEMDRLLDEVAQNQWDAGWTLVYSSASPEERKKLLRCVGSEGISAFEVGTRIEKFLGEFARRTFERINFSKLIVAGGETAGAVIDALKLSALTVQSVLEPGIPCLRTLGDRQLDVVLKSGNFGSPDFFVKAAHFLNSE